jgi:hypothetical protein
MPSGRESTHARERLRMAAPIHDDASLMKVREDVADYRREAARHDAHPPDELLSTVIDAVARSYFQHILQRQVRVTSVRRQTRA